MRYHPLLLILLSVLIVAPLWAEDIASQKASVNALIQEIKKAPSETRRIKMNELKILLRSMNQEIRNEAMSNLQKSFANHTSQKRNTIKTDASMPASQQSQMMQAPRQGQNHQGGGRR